MNLPQSVKRWLHQRGWVASPSLAFAGVPFGPEKRDLAGEVMAEIGKEHDPATCPVCSVPDEEWS
ncbi:hypothetical protein ACFWVB_20160 [Streptomyces microflavus]|uniref:hypothetical protein n=1 Tax=Streptomyces microflavus TaxID=1919 RepID=UPI00365A5C77